MPPPAPKRWRKSWAQSWCSPGPRIFVTDGTALHTVSGGSDLMRRVTGAGCMLTVLCGAFAAVQPQAPLQAAVQAAEVWKACAAAAEPQAHGPASFRVEPCWMLPHKSYNFILQVIVNHKKEEAELHHPASSSYFAKDVNDFVRITGSFLPLPAGGCLPI